MAGNVVHDRPLRKSGFSSAFIDMWTTYDWECSQITVKKIRKKILLENEKNHGKIMYGNSIYCTVYIQKVTIL